MSNKFDYDKNYDDIKKMLNNIRKAQMNEAEEIIKTKEETFDSKKGEELQFDNLNTVGYLSKSPDVQMSEDGKNEFTKAVGEMLAATGLLLPYVNIRLENGRVIITADVIKNPSLDVVKSISFDTDEEDPVINLVGGTLTLNQDLLNLLNTISRTYNDQQIGRNNLVKSTQTKPQI
jgi:biotin synthase-like enzyme